MEEEKILIFDVSGKEFAIEIKRVDRILSNSKVTFVPEKEDFIEGIIDYSDSVLTVINIAKLFSIEEIVGEERDSNIIVVTSKNEKIALKTNNVSRIISLEKENRELIPTLAFSESSYFKEVVKFEGKIIILLDVEKIIKLENRK